MTRAPLTQHGEATPGEDFGPAAGNVAKSQLDPSGAVASSTLPALNWIIVGGESGTGARPFDVAWARAIVQQCQAAGVPVFVKQLGARPIVPAGRLRHWEWGGQIGREARFEATDPLRESSAPWRVVLRDRAGGDPLEWPEDLRVREMPEPARA